MSNLVTPLTVLDPSQMTPESIGQDSSTSWGVERLKEYLAKRSQYAGKVVAVADSEKYESCGYDDGDMIYRRSVTVFDGSVAETFDSDVVIGHYMKNRATAWSVDASPQVMAAYHKWLLSEKLPMDALLHSYAVHGDFLRSLMDREEKARSMPPLKRGQTYKVVRGRKVPIGTMGKVFWFGDKGWGMGVGLNTSDRKDARGRNLDVVFVALKNLEYVQTEEERQAAEQELREIEKQRQINAADSLEAAKAAVDFYKQAVHNWLVSTGYDRESVIDRLKAIIGDMMNDPNNNPRRIAACGFALTALGEMGATGTMKIAA